MLVVSILHLHYPAAAQMDASRISLDSLMSSRCSFSSQLLSHGPPWAHYLGGYEDQLLGGPLGLPGLCHTTPDGVRRKDYGGEVLG
jgi:hypothetical protein